MIRASNAYEDKRNEITTKLRHYRSLVNNHQACKEVYDMMYPSGVQSLSDMPRCGSNTFEPERWAIRRINQKELMQASLDKMQSEYESIEDMINRLTGDYHTVILRRYVLSEEWEIIAKRMKCDKTTAWRWHNKAIDKLVKLATPCNI